MFAEMTAGEKTFVAVLAVLAIAGWSAAGYAVYRGSGFEAELASARNQLGKKSVELEAAQKVRLEAKRNIGELAEATEQREVLLTKLAKLKSEVADTNAELANLRPQEEAAMAALTELMPKLDSAKEEYAKLKRQIDEADSELGMLKSDIELNRDLLSSSATLYQSDVEPSTSATIEAASETESEAIREALEPTPETLETATVAEPAPEPERRTKPTVSPKKRFDRLDENGDGAISREEYNVGKIMLLDSADANGDGFLGADETAFSEEFFSTVDSDGDGNLSDLEFIDAGHKIFQVADTDRDGKLNREEVDTILRVSVQ